jgi:hypothetical protein
VKYDFCGACGNRLAFPQLRQQAATRSVFAAPQPKETLKETSLFDVLVSAPPVGKTVTLEVAPDHTLGSLVDTITSTLKLPKGKAFAIEHDGRLIEQADFGKTLGNLGIKETSKLTLRVVE